MTNKHNKNKEKEKENAKNQITQLFEEAQKNHDNPELCNEYVKKARTIQQKFRIRMPTIHKRRYCQHCHSYLIPTKNMTTRIHKSKIITTCKECKKHNRQPLK